MEKSIKKSKLTRVLTIIGCVFLIIMALFHGSGIAYISDIVMESNLKPFVKEIFPVLFAHPSIQLLGLAVLGLLTLSMKQDAKKVLFFISVLVLVDAAMAFYLGAIVPGILLALPALLFFLGGIKKS